MAKNTPSYGIRSEFTVATFLYGAGMAFADGERKRGYSGKNKVSLPLLLCDTIVFRVPFCSVALLSKAE